MKHAENKKINEKEMLSSLPPKRLHSTLNVRRYLYSHKKNSAEEILSGTSSQT